MGVTGLLSAISDRSGCLDAYAFLRRKLTRSQVAILVYHRVCIKEDAWSYKSISPQTFEKQIEYFSRSFEILSLDELGQYIHQGKQLPEKAVVITLDDGYKDNYLYAYPILQKHHIPATIFLCTGHVGNGDLLWWDLRSHACQVVGPGLRLPGQIQQVAGLRTGSTCARQGAKGDQLVVDLGDSFQMGSEACKVHRGGTGGQVAHQLCGEALVPAGKGGEQAEIVQQIGRHTAAHLPELIG